MNTPAQQTIDSSSERFARLFQLFDELATWGWSKLELFEISTPGATDALRCWAALNNHAVVDRAVTPPGAGPVFMLTVQVVKPNGASGAHISVQRYAGDN